jgi:RNA polymerase sigma factor (sigma-70 family)
VKKDTHYRTEEALWQAVTEGCEVAFEQLYRCYFSDLFYYGKQYLREEEAVNDAIQDLFVDIWRTRRSLGQARSVKLYLMISLRRKIHRSQRPEERIRRNWEDLPESVLPTYASAEAILAERENDFFQAERLNDWLTQLPARQHEALVLRYYHDMEYAEIAELLDIREQTSRNLVQKALQTLRKFSISLIFCILNFSV